MSNVFVVGDTAASNAWNGKPVPGLAPAAKQAGAHVARAIRARVEGRRDPGPFVYRHLGSLATIGRKAAVVDFGWLKLSGALAWWFWGAIHVGFLVDSEPLVRDVRLDVGISHVPQRHPPHHRSARGAAWEPLNKSRAVAWDLFRGSLA
jgi:hypothetical protein